MKKDTKAFLKYKRHKTSYRAVGERLRDYDHVAVMRSEDDTRKQIARCMDCGTPFCHWACPLGNSIPEWNDLAGCGQWRQAYNLLADTNDMPEVTSRVCPAICEYACVLGLGDEAVTVRENEMAIIEYAYASGWVSPKKRCKTGKKVAVVGSGPSGLAAAAALNRFGHDVVVFEKDERPGGLLRYGIPEFKLEKKILDRRIAIFKKSGIKFKTNKWIGKDITIDKLKKDFSAVVLSMGSERPRDLNIAGRNSKGIYFAMDYLAQSNRRVAGIKIKAETINAAGREVVVIGGGDTGSDCVGTAHRQGAARVTQIEIMPKPPLARTKECPWPYYPVLLKETSSHEEGGKRTWSVMTERFISENGHLSALSCVKVDRLMRKIKGSEFKIKADLAIIAVGFLGPRRAGIIDDLGLELDSRGNIKTNEDYQTSREGIFACGDAHRGQSLVVWALAEGRECAYGVNDYLKRKRNSSSRGKK